MPKHLLFFAAISIQVGCLPVILKGQVIPVRPAELLRCLPAPEPGWKMTISTAAHLRQNPPQSTATREYILPNDASVNPDGTNPIMLRVVLHDTAGDPDLRAMYSQTAANNSPGQWFSLEGMPAVRLEVPGKTGHVEGLVYDRFVLKLILSGPAKDRPEKWFGSINLPALRQLAAKPEQIDTDKTYEFNMEVVDELNPDRSRTLKFEIAGNARDKSRNREP